MGDPDRQTEADTSAATAVQERGLFLALISVHGRIRGSDYELGLEPDTGGQVLYVVELARALARQPEIERVVLFTRRIVDPDAAPDYAEPVEELSPGASIVRIDAGPEGFIKKEELWDHLDTFADNMLTWLREQDRLPDVVHAHYADAGYVGIRVANALGSPLVFTGHSLGRVKRRRLLASGASKEALEETYHISRRIEAEEETLAVADLVVTSTQQEVEQQYGFYDRYQPEKMRVVPPGLDLERFHPGGADDEAHYIEAVIGKFLRKPELPMVLAIARPDERKNLGILVRAFGENPELRRKANLVIVSGIRDDVREMDSQPKKIVTDMLLAIDAHDLYGTVAFPKHHRADDVPLYYRLAARRGGVFVNPALTEPFGLTLLESAASGLPVVATKDGGPVEIFSHCHNGTLIDPLDSVGIAQALLDIVSDREKFDRLAKNGIEGVRKHYSWDSHAASYIAALKQLPDRLEPVASPEVLRQEHLYNDRAVFTDIDQNLLGHPGAIRRFAKVMEQNRARVAFGIATGRTLRRAIQFLREQDLPQPDVLITSLGADIHYAPKLVRDTAWRDHIDHRWNPKAVRRILSAVPGLVLQDPREQDDFKISYMLVGEEAPDLEEVIRLLRNEDETANVFVSFGKFLDIVPSRASKGAAIRYVAEQWGIPIERILTAGGSGADEDMMRGNTLAVVVANRHEEELSQLVDLDRVHLAKQPFADGILEAMDHYDFFGKCEVPVA